MNKQLLQDYARLIATSGANVQKGEIVWINAQLDQPEFVAMVVEECYKLGAKSVEVRWTYEPLLKHHVKYQTVATLGSVNSMMTARYKYMVKNTPIQIHIISEDPDALKGVNQAKRAKSRMKSYPKIKKIYSVIRCKCGSKR